METKCYFRRGVFFIIICWITLHQLKIFRSAIAKKKEKDMDPICHNFYIVYWSRVKFWNNYFLVDFWWCQKWIISQWYQAKKFFFCFLFLKSQFYRSAGNVVKGITCHQAKDANSKFFSGKRCQRQPSANHTCVQKRLIDA